MQRAGHLGWLDGRGGLVRGHPGANGAIGTSVDGSGRFVVTEAVRRADVVEIVANLARWRE